MDKSSRVSIPNNVRPMIRDVKNVMGNHSDDEIYHILVECNMDINETIERLRYIDSFQEVRNRRDRKRGRGEGYRSPGQMARGMRWNYSYRPRDVTGGSSTAPRREIMLGEFIEKRPELSPTGPIKIKMRETSLPNINKKEPIAWTGNASNRQAVHEQGTQKSAEVASENSTETIVKVTPESVNGQTVSALDLQLPKINVNALKPLILPNSLRILDSFKGGLIFGRMDIAYEKSLARDLERVMPAATPDNEDIAKETFASDQGLCLIPQESDNLVHPESTSHVPEIAALQEGVSVDEAMKYDQQEGVSVNVAIQPTSGREHMGSEVPETKLPVQRDSSQASSSSPNYYQAAVDVPQSSLHVFPRPPPNYEHGTANFYQSYPYFFPYYPASSMHQYLGATTGFYQQPSTADMYPSSSVSGYGFRASPQVNSGGDSQNYPFYNQLAYPSAQAGQIQYAYPAMQQAPPRAGPNTYHYPAMQQIPTHAGPNLYHYPGMQQVPTQVGHNTYYYQAPQAGDDPAMQAHQAGRGSPYSYPRPQQ